MMRFAFQLILLLLPALLLRGQDARCLMVSNACRTAIWNSMAIVRTAARELALPCRFVLKEGALEVILGKPDGRMHEALLCTEIAAVQVQTMLYLLGAENGFRLPGEKGRQGDLIDLFIEWKDAQGKLVREPVENWIVDTRTGKNLEPHGWVFVGSSVKNGASGRCGGQCRYQLLGRVYRSGQSDYGSDDDTIHIVDASKAQPPQRRPFFWS